MGASSGISPGRASARGILAGALPAGIVTRSSWPGLTSDRLRGSDLGTGTASGRLVGSLPYGITVYTSLGDCPEHGRERLGEGCCTAALSLRAPSRLSLA